MKNTTFKTYSGMSHSSSDEEMADMKVNKCFYIDKENLQDVVFGQI